MYWAVALYCLLLGIETVLSDKGEMTLQAVHVIFRHGEKTPDRLSSYPNDPYLNETYYPYGLGQLTKKGKHTMYQLGKYLLHRYKHFIRSTLIPDYLEAYSSDRDRTKTSLQLILAALFPPPEEERVDKDLNWQPIPYSYSPQNHDVFFMSTFACSNFKIELQKTTQILRFNAKKNSDLKIFDYINNSTGTIYNNYIQVLMLYDGLFSQEQWGLRLPKWTTQVYPNDLKALAMKGFESILLTIEQKKMLGGYLLQKIIKDSLNIHKKMFLYSGHDLTLLALLSVLKLHNTLDSLPTFGETLFIELQKYNENYGFKIFLKRDANSTKLSPLVVPKCDIFCPIEKFIALTKMFMPDGLKTCGLYSENQTNILVHKKDGFSTAGAPSIGQNMFFFLLSNRGAYYTYLLILIFFK